MSLPGLGLVEPEEQQHAGVETTTEHELSKGSEWRFEVGFGKHVNVKVRVLMISGFRRLFIFVLFWYQFFKHQLLHPTKSPFPVLLVYTISTPSSLSLSISTDPLPPFLPTHYICRFPLILTPDPPKLTSP